ncbi:hypothetical protein PGT21_014530 [Puccinia graminis f. sp. tritici]|uniref:Dynamin-type G domain-containing protein n=1 Tax=Puccinia graminis f. sp. tritici TaxID=56615 RepID=A0A5B0N798_PUCGR|nr:hypothetical protein PGT21_014530 [Puccinia graminis f. sp. tritici]KAA1093251.1 hypothetical protein PGTUg99_002351 [Puccinia graminis f. sp. tritici]
MSSSAGEATAISCPRTLLDKVDEVRKLGLADKIPLPQIAVVGDQSSGKSTLLEYISGVTFPKDSGMCTCFVTEVMMRPAEEFSARVLVNGEVDSRLKVPESKDDVAAVIENAKALFMDGEKRVIYDDILTVELSGPELPMLTLVDLPGYVQTHTLGQSETIVQEIENLVEKYISEPRTIILAVIPATRDFETNVAIKYIRQFDGQGKRTLCVLTKPDLVDRGTESRVFETLAGDKMHLSRGYHIIKNKSYEDCRAGDPREETLKKESNFFGRAPWSSIPVTDRGIQNLIEKLTDTLVDQVQKEFSGIKKDVIQRKEKLSEQLKALGPVIETDLEKANLLQKNINEVMQQFKYLVDGHYGAGGFGQDLYLRSLVRDLNEVFNARIIHMTKLTTKHLDVSKIMKATRGRELRGMVPLEAFIILCRRVVQGWSSETHQHITKVCKLASNVFAQVIEKRCDKVLVNYFSERMIEFVDQQQKAMYHDALEILDDEINLPSTLQDTDFAKKWGTDENPEDNQMREILASYCLTAASRYIDAICMYVIERGLFKNCDVRGIKWFMDDPSALSRFREPRQNGRLREILPKEIQKLQDAISRL